MLRRVLRDATFYLGTAYSLWFYAEQLKRRIDKLADTDTVYNERQYVLVRLARGDYNNVNGPRTLKDDYKFYQIITKSIDD